MEQIKWLYFCELNDADTWTAGRGPEAAQYIYDKAYVLIYKFQDSNNEVCEEIAEAVVSSGHGEITEAVSMSEEEILDDMKAKIKKYDNEDLIIYFMRSLTKYSSRFYNAAVENESSDGTAPIRWNIRTVNTLRLRKSKSPEQPAVNGKSEEKNTDVKAALGDTSNNIGQTPQQPTDAKKKRKRRHSKNHSHIDQSQTNPDEDGCQADDAETKVSQNNIQNNIRSEKLNIRTVDISNNNPDIKLSANEKKTQSDKNPNDAEEELSSSDDEREKKQDKIGILDFDIPDDLFNYSGDDFIDSPEGNDEPEEIDEQSKDERDKKPAKAKKGKADEIDLSPSEFDPIGNMLNNIPSEENADDDKDKEKAEDSDEELSSTSVAPLDFSELDNVFNGLDNIADNIRAERESRNKDAHGFHDGSYDAERGNKQEKGGKSAFKTRTDESAEKSRNKERGSGFAENNEGRRTGKREKKREEKEKNDDESERALLNEIFGETKVSEKREEKHSEIDDALAEAVARIEEKFEKHINILIKGFKNYEAGKDVYYELISELAGSYDFDDFCMSWQSIEPNYVLPKDFNQPVYESLHNEAVEYEKVCDLLYSNFWDN